jgi:hypothetical protein
MRNSKTIVYLTVVILFIKLCLSQNLISKTPTKCYDYGWCVLDIKFNSGDCEKDSTSVCEYIYFINGNNEYIIDLFWRQIRYAIYPSPFSDYYVPLPEMTMESYNSVFANSNYFYLRHEYGLWIYGIGFWNNPATKEFSGLPSLDISKYLFTDIRNFGTPWYLGENGLYALRVQNNQVFLRRKSLDGKDNFLDISIPNILPSLSDLFVCESLTIAYIVSPGLVTTADINNGNILLQWPIKRNVNATVCYGNSVFILHDDSKVIQYSDKGNIIYTYKVPDRKIPPFSQLMISQDNLIYVLCDNKTTISYCDDPKIYRWTIIKNPENLNFIYTRDNFKTGGLVLTDQKSLRNINLNSTLSTFASVRQNISLSQNSFLDIAVRNQNESILLIYFSGGGNLQEHKCEAMMLNILKIDGYKNFSPIVNSVSQISLASQIFDTLNDYASIVLSIGQNQYFLIHGGLSCDCQTVYSTLFAVQLSDYRVINLQQNSPIS